MKTTHTIVLHQLHIDNGIRHSGTNCPVALALVQHFGRLVYVGRFCWSFEGGTNYVPRGFPIEVSRFIDDFDEERPVKPTKFELQLMDQE